VTVLPPKLSRYAAVASLLLKYGRGAAEAEPDAHPTTHSPRRGDPGAAGALARDLESLGPTFVKLGQLLSTRADLLPPAYLEALSRLQDAVEPVPFAQIKDVVESDLGVRLSKAFTAFDERPLAAASLGQVHRAALRDGRVVAVKVQRPGVAEQVAVDLDVLDQIAEYLSAHTDAGQRYDLAGMVHEFRAAITAELDYVQEAEHLQTIGCNLAEFDAIVVPQPVAGYTATRVLTMDYVSGTKVTAISPVARVELDHKNLADTLVRAYLTQIVIDGVFHADPHPGNVFVTDDGRLALIDLGMIGRLSPQMQERLLKLLLAVSEGRGEEAADVAVTLGEKLADFNEPGFRRDLGLLVGRIGHQSVADVQIGAVFLELSQLIRDHHMRAPAELTMLGKTLLNIDQVARALDPELDVNEAIRRNGADLMTKRLRKAVTSGSVIAAALEAKDFAQKLPGRVNRVLDSLAASELKLKVELIDHGEILEGLQKIANRISIGLVVAALILAAALIAR
jgi:predicted unusual protein kinase regulating ubiquinone biosynthesis (AarF/ABC1/UbiB family)